MSHHAGGNRPHFRRMAAGPAASFSRNAQIAGIDKLDVFRGFLQPQRVGAFGEIHAILKRRIARLHVRLFLDGLVFH